MIYYFSYFKPDVVISGVLHLDIFRSIYFLLKLKLTLLDLGDIS